MTFADLFDALAARGVLKRAAVQKSYLKTLATALGASLDTCVVETAYRHEATWLERLEDHRRGPPRQCVQQAQYEERTARPVSPG